MDLCPSLRTMKKLLITCSNLSPIYILLLYFPAPNQVFSSFFFSGITFSITQNITNSFIQSSPVCFPKIHTYDPETMTDREKMSFRASQRAKAALWSLFLTFPTSFDISYTSLGFRDASCTFTSSLFLLC